MTSHYIAANDFRSIFEMKKIVKKSRQMVQDKQQNICRQLMHAALSILIACTIVWLCGVTDTVYRPIDFVSIKLFGRMGLESNVQLTNDHFNCY